MRAVVQRVSEARVEVEGRDTGRIGPGLLVLLGISPDDDERDVRYMAEKVTGLRIFHDAEGKMNRSVVETGGGVLTVSNFTLYGDVRRGKRPSFGHAAPPERAEPLYEKFMGEVAAAGVESAGGVFGAMMRVSLVNDGPVTILIDSRKVF